MNNMVLYDFRCTYCHFEFDEAVQPGTTITTCTCGSEAKQVWVTPPKVGWAQLAMGSSASPEAIARFDRSHKQRREKEEAHQREHGDDLRGAGG